MIEEINKGLSLFKVIRKEGTIIKQSNYYWVYIIEYEGCEDCGKEIERKGWNNVTNIVIEAKKEVLEDWIRRLSSVSQEDVIFPFAGQDFRNKVIEFIKEEKRHLSNFSKRKAT